MNTRQSLVPVIAGTMVIYILRHAHAVGKDGAPDHHRRVSEKGKGQIAKFIEKYGALSPDLLVTTELFRATETANGILAPTAGPFLAMPHGFSLPIGKGEAAELCDRGYVMLGHKSVAVYADPASYMVPVGELPALSGDDADQQVGAYTTQCERMVRAVFHTVEEQIEMGREVRTMLCMSHGNYGLGMLWVAAPDAFGSMIDMIVNELHGAKVTITNGKVESVEAVTL